MRDTDASDDERGSAHMTRGESVRRPRRSKTAGVRVVRKGAESQVALWRQVYAQLRDSIVAGGLRAGSLVPASRTLARELKVSRNTVEAALLRLAAEGLVVRRVGSGTRVAASARREPGSVEDSRQRDLE